MNRRALISGALALPIVLASGKGAEAAPLPEGLDRWFVDHIKAMAPDPGDRASLYVVINPDVLDAVFVPIWDKAPEGWVVYAGCEHEESDIRKFGIVGPAFDCDVPVVSSLSPNLTITKVHTRHFSIDFNDEWWAISDQVGRVRRLTKNFVTIIN